jgi:hypothetical protein
MRLRHLVNLQTQSVMNRRNLVSDSGYTTQAAVQGVVQTEAAASAPQQVVPTASEKQTPEMAATRGPGPGRPPLPPKKGTGQRGPDKLAHNPHMIRGGTPGLKRRPVISQSVAEYIDQAVSLDDIEGRLAAMRRARCLIAQGYEKSSMLRVIARSGEVHAPSMGIVGSSKPQTKPTGLQYLDNEAHGRYSDALATAALGAAATETPQKPIDRAVIPVGASGDMSLSATGAGAFDSRPEAAAAALEGETEAFTEVGVGRTEEIVHDMGLVSKSAREMFKRRR